MRRLVTTSPTRVDLAGGTLDIWPLNLLVERAVTVNVAIDLLATCSIEEIPGPPARAALIRSEDTGIEETWLDVADPPGDSRLPLIARCVRWVGPARGFRLTTRSGSPAGAGLGGSSSLALSVLAGLEHFAGRPLTPPVDLISVARDIEAQVLRIPTGNQDHFAATFGGAAAIHLGPGPAFREVLPVDLERLAARLVLVYTGASRVSGNANWDMMRRAVDGEERTLNGLRAIAAIANDMRAALVKGDLDAAAGLLDREWNERRTLSPRVSTDFTEKTMEAARRAGATAGKVCGAGGGGCIAFLCREEKRANVVAALEALAGDGVKVLPARPTAVGLQVAWK